MSAPPTTAASGERFGAFHLRVLVLLMLALIADSYDLQATSFAAPILAKVWQVEPRSFAPLFGAGLAGVFVGTLGLGWFGDRFGRKRAIVFACCIYGIFSLLCMLAQNQQQIFWLRFLMGLGCGGAMPNVVALATELAPVKRRGLLTLLIFIGMPIGGAIPGYVASALVPSNGWQAIFLVGGVAPLLFGILIWLMLPESPAFLAARKAGRSAVSRKPMQALTLLRLLSPAFIAPTLLLWVMFTATLMTIYLQSSWLPTILSEGGLTPLEIANLTLLYAAGGAVSSIAIGLLIDRVGLFAVLCLFALAIASVLGVAYSDVSQGGLAGTIFLCGFALTGVQGALNASAGLLYPADIRSSGVGAAFGIGRAGSILGALLGGPIVSGALGSTLGLYLGGIVDATTFSGTKLFLVPVPVLLIGLIASALLMRLRDVRAVAPVPGERAIAH